MDNTNLIRHLELSAMAYADTHPQAPGRETFLFDDKRSGVQYIAQKGGGQLSIAFRGTDSLKDFITDIRFWKTTIPYGNTLSPIRVHTGFIEAYKSPGVRKNIWKLAEGEIHKVVVCGHSYGAALCVLCALDLQYNFPEKDIEAFPFGGPRVGNRAFARSYDGRVFKTFRVENGNDTVTKLPFEFLGYRHVGIDMHIGPPRITGVFSWADHNLRRYYESLWKRLSI